MPYIVGTGYEIEADGRVVTLKFVATDGAATLSASQKFTAREAVKLAEHLAMAAVHVPRGGKAIRRQER